jgi:hypothetical protein
VGQVIRLRPMPPRCLSPAQRDFWRVVVDLKPPDYFQGDDLLRLAEYCAVCAAAGPLWDAIKESHASLHTPDGSAFLSRLSRLQAGQSRRMIRLHRQLRLGRYRTDV